MKVFGNAELIKEEIEKSFSSRIEAAAKEREEELASLKAEGQQKEDALNVQIQAQVEHDAKVAYEKVYNESFSLAKRDFELFREQLYDQIFEDILKNAAAVCKKKEFVDMVARYAKSLGKNAKVRCHPSAKAALAKKVKGKVVADKSIQGALIEVDGTYYDLSLPTLLEAKRDHLRKVITDAL